MQVIDFDEFESFLFDWLEENSGHFLEILHRYHSQSMLSASMRRDIKQGIAYALGKAGVDKLDFMKHVDAFEDFELSGQARKRQYIASFLEGHEESAKAHLIGNQHAVTDDPKSTYLQVRITPVQKKRFLAAAQGGKLSKWIIDACEEKIEKTQEVDILP